MEVVFERCAGIDVHKKSIAVCVRIVEGDRRPRRETRSFGTLTDELEALREWLRSQGVTHVAMESTGVYWKPIFNVLEPVFTVILCNARHVKQVPGRKTDVTDCEWLAQLLACGLLQASFVPDRELRDLRDLTRTRTKLVQERTRHANRLHKVLEDANVKLGSVAADVLGKSGRAMIRAIIAGEEDADAIAERALSRMRGKIPTLRRALRGAVTEHHRFMLRFVLDQIEHLDRSIVELDERVALLTRPSVPAGDASAEALEPQDTAPLFPGDDDPEPPAPAPTPSAPSPGSSEPPPSPPQASGPPANDAFHAALALLTTIPGISLRTAEVVLAEIGPDMSRFPTSGHLASWAGICPGNNESAGKRRSGATNKGNAWLRSGLVQAAWAAGRTKRTYFGAQFARLARKRGKKRAVVAVGHSLLTVVHALLSAGRPYEELGADYFDRLNERRLAVYHQARLEALGYEVRIAKAPTEAA